MTTVAWQDNEGHCHKHKVEEREVEIIIKDSLVIIVLGELDDDHLRNALASFLDTKGVKVADK